MPSDAVVAYTYQADTFCPDCTVRMTFGAYLASQGFNRLGIRALQNFVVENIKEEKILDYLAERDLIDRYDEHSFDSQDFPKVVFESQLDTTEYCGECREELG